ncbi:MAG: DUF1491 family protein [Alphaproteobacteria bacterium]
MAWTSSKIRAGMWVQVQVRLCDLNCIPIMVRHKGDPDSGAILLKLDRGAPGSSVLSQVRDVDGVPAWMHGGGAELVSDADAEAYIKRQIDRDPDLWVIEIDDPGGRYKIDGNIV